ncbi:MAG: hypothetical protein ACHQVS_02085 [Candidatus Babeliales bacterium]
MKKTLLMLLAASLISIPVTTSCMAAKAPMSRLAKSFVLLGLAGIGVVSYKVSHWYKQQEAVKRFNVLHRKFEQDYKAYAYLEEPNAIKTLLQDELTHVREKIEKELREPAVPDMVSLLLPYTACTATKNNFYVTCSDEQLKEHCACIERGKINDAEVVFGPCEYSATYAWNVLRYAGNKTKQIITWVVRKPSLDQETRKRFVEVLQKYCQLQKVLSSVCETINKEFAAKIEKEHKANSAAQRTVDQHGHDQPIFRGSCSAAPLAEPPVQPDENKKN